MKQMKLNAKTVDQLVKQFSEIGVAQDGALLENDINKFNHLYDQMEAVELELKSRGSDQRQFLLSLSL